MLMSDFKSGRFAYDYGETKDGSIYASFDNDDYRAMIEDVYQLKEDIKALIESDYFKTSLKDWHFIKV